MGITEVGRETCNTSVKSEQAESLRSWDYGSGGRNLLYFRKFRFRERRIEWRITEVEGETCNTSVKSEQVRGLGEQGLRKWGEKSALLP